MKKLIFVLLALAFIFASCSNSSDGGAGIGGVPSGGTTTSGGNGGGTGSGGAPVDADSVLIGASNLVYIGEGTETVDATEYKVKKYADILVDNPYFYTYYKVYYLNDKVRRVYQFDHGIGSAMDYKYTEFVEHNCTGRNYPIIYTYYENGKLESTTRHLMSGANWTPIKTLYEYDSSGNKRLEKSYQNNVLYSEYCYYSNGRTKFIATYDNSTITTFRSYYESGYIKYYFSYGNNLYSWTDGKVTEEDYYAKLEQATEQTYTADQAAAKLAELRNN